MDFQGQVTGPGYGFVYVMSYPGSGMVKIGHSLFPDTRASQIGGTLAPEQPVLECYFWCSERREAVERKAHALQAHVRGNGEWFDISVAVAMQTIQDAAAEVSVSIQLVFARQEGGFPPAPQSSAGAGGSQRVEVRIPDIGDFKDVVVIEVLVKVGDTVKVDESLITVECDKASMEIPSSATGLIRELRVKVGDKVEIGDLVAIVQGREATLTREHSEEVRIDAERRASEDPKLAQEEEVKRARRAEWDAKWAKDEAVWRASRAERPPKSAIRKFLDWIF